MEEINIIKEYIRSTQSNKRFLHTCGVAGECEKIAALLGFSKEDQKKLVIAGWLHDITKEADDSLQETLCRKFNIKIPEKGFGDPILHARTGAYYARMKFPDLVDETIFSAIYNHTTGCRGMSVFDSIVHSLGTAGTGGFAIKSDGLAGYSPYCQWVITIFMLVFGINFNLFYLLLLRKFRSILKSEELWVYISIVLIAGGLYIATISLEKDLNKEQIAGLVNEYRV